MLALGYLNESLKQLLIATVDVHVTLCTKITVTANNLLTLLFEFVRAHLVLMSAVQILL
jgi:hypothetical protein